MKEIEKIYVTHTCKNLKCQRAFVDEDLIGGLRVPTWKYCPECTNLGFVNKKTPPKRRLSDAQLKTLKYNYFKSLTTIQKTNENNEQIDDQIHNDK